MSTTTTTTTTKTKPAFTTTTLIGMPSETVAATEPEKERRYPRWGQEGGTDQMMADEAQRRIQELETQVHFFKMQSTGAAEKLTEYDHEVRRLRSQATDYTPRTSRSSRSSAVSNDIDGSLSPTQLPMSNGGGHAPPPQPQPQTQTSRLFNLTSLFPYARRSSATPPPAPASPAPVSTSAPQVTAIRVRSPPGPDPEETVQLQHALGREQSLRKAAENQLTQANTELEDLTVQLFSQANEMVAQERKARARLEERVAVLERRDVEKRKRLDRLEKSMQRVERLRSLVG